MDSMMFYNYNDVDRLRGLLIICPGESCKYTKKSTAGGASNYTYGIGK